MTATTLADRAVLRLSGEAVRDFLQGLVTSDVAGELPVWTGLLTPQGKCSFDFLVWADDADVLLDCEAAAADDLARRLSLYRLRRPITIERDSAQAVHWTPTKPFGLSLSKPCPSSEQDEKAASFDAAQDRLRQAQGEGVVGPVPDPRLATLGHRWLAPANDPASGWLEYRLRLGVCEGRAELGDVLWLECNAAELNGVSFTKGCFVGQENTARMNWRSKVSRRLLVAQASEPGPRTRVHYPELGLAVEHRRLDDLAGAIIPDWLQPALRA